MAGRSSSAPIAVCDGIHNLHSHVSHKTYSPHATLLSHTRFLPLSFFTSLFGVNVREWSGEETNPDWAYMLSVAG
jgi:hypothetical protein